MAGEKAEIIELIDAWDDLDSAINRTVTALPGQMTAASERLETERSRFRKMMHEFALRSISEASN